MKFSIDTQNLVAGLKACYPIISPKSNLPILHNFHFSVQQGDLTITCTNLQTSVQYKVGSKVDQDGQITVLAKPFFEYAALLTVETISVNAEAGKLKIQTSDSQASFPTMPAAEFPQLPAPSSTFFVQTAADRFGSALRRVLFATAKDETQPVLNSVLLVLEEKQLRLVGTDGFRLSETIIEDMEWHKFKQPLRYIILADSLNEVRRLLGSDDKIEIIQTKTENQLACKIGKAVIFCRLLEAEYPQYEKIIPDQSPHVIKVNREVFEQAVKSVAVFTSLENKNLLLKMDPKQGRLALKAQNVELGESEHSVIASIEGEGMTVGFNSHFLLDLLAHMSGDELQMAIKEPMAPVVFINPQDPHFRHIIMPLRLSDS